MKRYVTLKEIPRLNGMIKVGTFFEENLLGSFFCKLRDGSVMYTEKTIKDNPDIFAEWKEIPAEKKAELENKTVHKMNDILMEFAEAYMSFILSGHVNGGDGWADTKRLKAAKEKMENFIMDLIFNSKPDANADISHSDSDVPDHSDQERA